MRRLSLSAGFTLLLGAALALGVGCKWNPESTEGKKHVDEHPEKGPNGGPLAEVGENDEHHAELVLDTKSKQATVNIVDGKATKYVPIKEKSVTIKLKSLKNQPQIELKASPREGEKDGSSRFIGTDDKLGEKLDPEQIEVTVKIGGKQYHATFEVHHDDD